MALVGDERGQAVQIGAVLLFAVLIVSFSTYQAFIVPNQNRQVEFNHNQEVQRDMIDVRNTLLETYTGGNDGFAEVTLGTNYPARLVSTNPGPPSGSLRTTEARGITVYDRDDGTDITDEVCPGSSVQTRFLEYEPGYNVYQGAGTLRYENSIVFHDFGSDGVALTDQTLVRGQDIQIIPITRDLSVGGTQTVSVEPKAGLLDRTQVDNVRVTLPTELSESRWETLLDGEVSPSDVTVSGGAGSRTVELILDDEPSYTLACGPVGIGEVPPSGERRGGIDDINPAAPGEIRLIDETRSGSVLTLDFQNSGGDNEFIEARINFYNAQGGSTPTQADISSDGTDSGTLQVRGDFVQLDPDITLNGNDAVTQIRLDFDVNLNSNDWLVLSLQLESGETALYFIPIP